MSQSSENGEEDDGGSEGKQEKKWESEDAHGVRVLFNGGEE